MLTIQLTIGESCCWTYHLEQFTWISAWSWTFNRHFSASVKNFPVCSVLKTTLKRIRNFCAFALYKFIIYITLHYITFTVTITGSKASHFEHWNMSPHRRTAHSGSARYRDNAQVDWKPTHPPTTMQDRSGWISDTGDNLTPSAFNSVRASLIKSSSKIGQASRRWSCDVPRNLPQ